MLKTLTYSILSRKTNNLVIQLFRYTIVGGAAFFVDYVTLIGLTEVAGLHYLFSATIAFIVGLTLNYLISVRWVFESSDIPNKRLEFLAYAIIGIIGLSLNNVFLYVFTDMVCIHYAVSKPLAAILVFSWNFFSRRFLIFSPKKSNYTKWRKL